MNSTWRKSTHSNAEGNCVETRLTDQGIGVRDSKDTSIPALRLSPQAWAAFITSDPVRK